MLLQLCYQDGIKIKGFTMNFTGKRQKLFDSFWYLRKLFHKKTTSNAPSNWPKTESKKSNSEGVGGERDSAFFFFFNSVSDDFRLCVVGGWRRESFLMASRGLPIKTTFFQLNGGRKFFSFQMKFNLYLFYFHNILTWEKWNGNDSKFPWKSLRKFVFKQTRLE